MQRSGSPLNQHYMGEEFGSRLGTAPENAISSDRSLLKPVALEEVETRLLQMVQKPPAEG